MKKSTGTVALVISTVCILLIHITNFIEFLQTGDKGSTFSNLCLLLGLICLAIAWISYFVQKKKESK